MSDQPGPSEKTTAPRGAEPAGDAEAGPARGILLKVGSVLLFTLMAVCIKAARVEAPAGETVFFRSFFALIPLLAYMAFRRELPAALKTANPVGHVTRGLVGVTAMGLGFTALGLLPLPEATAIGYASPIFATLLAAAVLGETIRAFRIIAVATGMVGVLIILWPKLTLLTEGATSGEALGALAALIGAFFTAIAMIIVRRMVATERASTIVFYFSITSSVVGLATAPFGWINPSPEMWAYLIGAGLLGGVGQILLTEAYKFAEASTIAPFDYSSMIFAVLLGWSLFGEIPGSATVAGSAVVVAAGVLIIWRERQLGIERSKARRAGAQQI